MLKSLQNFMSKCKNVFDPFVHRIKTTEFVGVFISAVVSAMAEFFRQALLILKEADFTIDNEFYHMLMEHRLEIAHNIINIFLITAIVWGITGIVDILKFRSTSRTAVVSLSVLLTFAFSVAWYSCEIIIVLSKAKLIIESIVVGILYFLLFVFFSDPNKKVDGKSSYDDYLITSTFGK